MVAAQGAEGCVMAAFPKEISELMSKYSINFDEVWKIPQGNAYAVKHKALERVAVEQKIMFEMPQIEVCDIANKMVALVVIAKLGDRSEWATGEAAPYNNKNGYPLAMAEKRAKDRCILKLLQAHGSVYSEEEAEDFKRQNPHVTHPTDIVPAVEYDEYGEPVDNIPSGDPSIERLSKKDARADYEAALKEMRATETVKQLQTWGERNANRVASYPSDWGEILRGLFIEHRDSLRGGQKNAA
jgi:hypothetical protein